MPPQGLWKRAATGVQFKKAILACRNSGEDDREFVRIILSDPVITSYESSCDSVDQESPIDRITIDYSKIELEYRAAKRMASAASSRVRMYDTRSEKSDNRGQRRKSVSLCAVKRFRISRGNHAPRQLGRSSRKLSERRWR